MRATPPSRACRLGKVDGRFHTVQIKPCAFGRKNSYRPGRRVLLVKQSVAFTRNAEYLPLQAINSRGLKMRHLQMLGFAAVLVLASTFEAPAFTASFSW